LSKPNSLWLQLLIQMNSDSRQAPGVTVFNDVLAPLFYDTLAQAGQCR